MKNVKRFVRHAKKITRSGNIKFDPAWADMPYSRYVHWKKRKDITRIEFLDSYFMVTEWYNDENNTPLDLLVDDKVLRVIPDTNSDAAHFMDVETGEIMLTLDIGSVEYSTDWAEQKYQWKTK
jgi:hypothetical protein